MTWYGCIIVLFSADLFDLSAMQHYQSNLILDLYRRVARGGYMEEFPPLSETPEKFCTSIFTFNLGCVWTTDRLSMHPRAADTEL